MNDENVKKALQAWLDAATKLRQLAAQEGVQATAAGIMQPAIDATQEALGDEIIAIQKEPTRKDWERYFDDNCSTCPKCGSIAIEVGSIDERDREILQPASCHDCGYDWQDVYLVEAAADHLGNTIYHHGLKPGQDPKWRDAFLKDEFRTLLGRILIWHEHTEEQHLRLAGGVTEATFKLGEWLKKQGLEWEMFT